MNPNPTDALIVIDVQNDFFTGALAVPQAADIILPVNRALAAFKDANAPIIFTRCWHPPHHCSFGRWPVHCVQDTWGAEFDKRIHVPKLGEMRLFSKGVDKDREGYSAFEDSFLQEALAMLHVENLYLAGLALDHCVRETALDARRLDFSTTVLLHATRPVSEDDGARAVEELLDAGVFLREERR